MLSIDYEKTYANALRLEIADRVKAVALEEGLTIIQVYADQRKKRKKALVEVLLEKHDCHAGIGFKKTDT
jgi:hypothetical protein